MSIHPLPNFKMKIYYQNKPKFNCIYFRNNLPKIKDGTYVINLDEFKSIRNHWIALFVNGNNITYFDSLGLKHIPTEINNFIGNTNIMKNIYRIQAYDSVMCGHSHVWFVDSLLKGKSLLDSANLLSPNDYQKNNTKIFSATKNMKKLYCVICGKYKKFEKPIITYIFLFSSFVYLQ